jgi:GntR family transcriptional repressor for pyruvate dehydrogenase complex
VDKKGQRDGGGRLKGQRRKGPVQAPRVAELVAAELRRRIIEGSVQDELPREKELLEDFGVSRPSLREALRILESDGLIRIRRGKIGGATVNRPTSAGAAFHFGLVLQSEGASVHDLATARSVIEPACAELMGGRSDRKRQAKKLISLIRDSETFIGREDESFTASAAKFHEAIVSNCGNRTLDVLAGALEAVWHSQELGWAEVASSRGRYPEAKLQKDAVAAHHKIAELIGKGDGPAAGVAMKRHLASSQAPIAEPERPIDVLGDAGRILRE